MDEIRRFNISKKNTSGNDPPFKQIYLKNMQRTTDLYDLEYMLFILGVF